MNWRVWAAVVVAAGLAAPGCGKKAASTTPGDPAPPPGGTQPTPPKEPAGEGASADAKQESALRLQKLVLAVHASGDANNGQLPLGFADPTGKTIVLSWRVFALPYIGETDLYRQFKFDEPWDGPTNKPLIARMPKAFAAPGKDPGEGKTYYQAFAGKGAYIDPDPDPTKHKGFVKGTRLPASFTDGMTSTAIFAEAAEPVIWTKPDDLKYDPTRPLPKLGGVFPDGCHLAFADGTVQFYPTGTLTDKYLKAIITLAGNDFTARPKDLPPAVRYVYKAPPPPVRPTSPSGRTGPSRR